MKRLKRIFLAAVALGAVGAIPQQAAAECGVASWYGGKFHGRRTANGEVYNMHGVSAAHKRLRFGTRVRVTHRGTGRTIVVRINDRGPFIRGRIIDLSGGARNALGMGGLAPVCLEVLSHGNNRYVAAPKSGATKARATWRNVAPKRQRVARTRPSSPSVRVASPRSDVQYANVRSRRVHVSQ
jgi:rare lipoprotein A